MRLRTAFGGVFALAVWLALIGSHSALAGGFSPRNPSFPPLFEAFNDSYKQALYATQQGDKTRSAAELAGTRIAWHMVLSRFYEVPPEQFRSDAHWRDDLARVTGYLEIAALEANAGNLKEAHGALEPIRHVWLGIRERAGVAWFGDALTRFHDVMEPVVQSAAAGVNDANVAEFDARLDALLKGWSAVQAFTFRPPAAEQKRFQDAMASENQAVENLRNAAAARDYPRLKPLADAVQKGSVSLYLRFG